MSERARAPRVTKGRPSPYESCIDFDRWDEIAIRIEQVQTRAAGRARPARISQLAVFKLGNSYEEAIRVHNSIRLLHKPLWTRVRKWDPHLARDACAGNE